MQLSASTSSAPVDTSLAANFFATGGSASDTAALDKNSSSAEENPAGFDDLLSDAAEPASDETATAESTDTVLGGPTAAQSLVNFPQWLLGGEAGAAPVVVNAATPTTDLSGTGVNANATDADASASATPANSTGATPVKTGRSGRPCAQPSGTGSNRAVPATAAVTSAASAEATTIAAQMIVPAEVIATPAAEAAGNSDQTGVGQQAGVGKGFASLPMSPRAPAGSTTQSAAVAGVAEGALISDSSAMPDSFAQNFASAQTATAASAPALPARHTASDSAPTTLEADMIQAIGDSTVPPISTTARASSASEVTASGDQAAITSPQDSSSDVSPAIQFDGSIPTREEIFAAIDGQNLPGKNSSVNALEKTFLSSAAKRVTTRSTAVGTGVAKWEADMPSATFTTRQSFVAPLERAIDVPVANATAAASSPQSTEPTAVAHRAVDAVMTAVERFTTGDRHSVQMQFSVGGTDLSVRVEMRGDEVRTTFRTDSSELRNALAHEWQSASASADSADRSVRVTPPVFASNNSSAFSGDDASRQRDARTQKGEADDFISAVAARSRSVSAFGSAVADAVAPAARAFAPATALHLSTLA